MNVGRREFIAGSAAAFVAGSGSLRAEDKPMSLVPSGHSIIYQHEKFYSAFPSIVVRPDGEIMVAFRRAPNRLALGEGGNSHTDPNSYLVYVSSRDNAKSWSTEPKLIFAHPFGGSQDPCLLQLTDGSIVCTSYGWALLDSAAAAKVHDTLRHGNFCFLGGYIVRLDPGKEVWSGPFIPPPLEGNKTHDVFGNPIPVYNRGQMCQGRDGRLYWVIAYQDQLEPRRTSNHLMVSEDRGETWKYSCPVAVDSKVTFNEASLYETPKGDLVAFIRTADFNDHTVIARSTDGGKSFLPWQDAGFQGHPHYALRLPDDRVLLIYGYRHQPFGIRVRILNAECTDFTTAQEIIIRDDGGNGDIGYPWAAMTPDGRVLLAYYFNKGDGQSGIWGTICDYK